MPKKKAPPTEVAVFEDEHEITIPSILAKFGERAINPLIVLGEERLAELDDEQQHFLLARMVAASDRSAATAVSITPNKVTIWKKQPKFMEAYNVVVQDPVAFALHVNRFLVAKAALEHMSLILHPNVRVRQWAIEMAYRNNQVGTTKDIRVTGELNHTFNQLRELARETPFVEEREHDDEYIDGVRTGLIEEKGRVD